MVYDIFVILLNWESAVCVCKEKSKEEKRGTGRQGENEWGKGLLSLVFYECLCPRALGKPGRGNVKCNCCNFLKIPQRDLFLFIITFFL